MRVLYLSDRETLTSLPQEVLEMVVNKLHVDEKVYSFACACAFMHCIGAINCKSQYLRVRGCIESAGGVLQSHAARFEHGPCEVDHRSLK